MFIDVKDDINIKAFTKINQIYDELNLVINTIVDLSSSFKVPKGTLVYNNYYRAILMQNCFLTFLRRNIELFFSLIIYF